MCFDELRWPPDRRLTRDSRVETVWAVVHPTEEETAEERLQRTFDAYSIVVDARKIRIVEGTPAKFRFGLGKEGRFELAADVGQVFNGGSSTEYTERSSSCLSGRQS